VNTRAARLLRAVGTAGVVSLAVFHAALLLRRLAEPGGLDAAAAWRWAGALLLLGACFALRRSAGRLSPRQVMALALVAVALHAPVLQGPADAARAAEFWIALPAVLVPALALLAATAAPGALRLEVRSRLAPAPVLRAAKVARAPFSPRPPPLL
jgi:hypothetical protein